MIYIQLFWSFFQIGLFSIGGGYAAMPLIEDQAVNIHGWLSLSQFGDLMTIAEMTPGPIVVNSATFVGTQVAGIPGAVISTLGSITPACFIVLLLTFLYYRYHGLSLVQGILKSLRPTVVAMIASAGLSLLLMAIYGQKYLPDNLLSFDYFAVGIFAISFFALKKYKLKPIYIMLLSGVLGLLIYS